MVVRAYPLPLNHLSSNDEMIFSECYVVIAVCMHPWISAIFIGISVTHRRVLGKYQHQILSVVFRSSLDSTHRCQPIFAQS